MVINPALLNDIQTIKKAIQDNLAIVRPTAFQKMQLDELLYLHEAYQAELERVTKGIKSLGTESLSQSLKTMAKYQRHETFSNKARGL